MNELQKIAHQNLLQNLYNQYNSQNDWTEPTITEKYKYELTHSEFCMIENMLKRMLEKIHVKNYLR